MPQSHEHLTRAKENEQLAIGLGRESGCSTDWAITMLFYAALHYIDAFLAGKNMHPLNHEKRDGEIENNGSLAAIFKDYRRLKDLSRAARYEIANFREDQLEVARRRLKVIKGHLGHA
jgi:hypothetical protein